MHGTSSVHRTRAALAVAVLGLVVGAGGVASAASGAAPDAVPGTVPGVVPAADAPPASVPLMPGTHAPDDVIITDDAVYTMSMENGRAIYRRSLATDASGTNLGPATFLAHSTADGGMGVHEGTVAFARPFDGRLVLLAPDGTETVPAWDDGLTFYRGLTDYTGTWITSHLIGMNYQVRDVETGTPVDLMAASGELPPQIDAAYVFVRHSDDRVLWRVVGVNYSSQWASEGLYTSALDGNGLTGPVDTLHEELCAPSCAGSGSPLTVSGDLIAWTTDHTASSVTVRWFTAPPYTGTPQELTVATSPGTERVAGTELVTRTTGDGATTLTWYDLTSASPAVPVRTATVPGWVLDVQGSLVAYRTPAGAAFLTDVSGGSLTADPAPALTPGFTDVPPADVWNPDRGFRAEIQWLADHGIVGGYPDGTFRPLGAVNRDAMAAFLYRAAHDGARAPACMTAPFADVAVSHPFCGEIAWLATTGVTTGWPDGTFRPGSAVTREAMAAFLYRFAHDGADAPACTEAPFTDVATAHPFCGEITWTADAGISRGWADGTFRPGLLIERQAMAAFLFRFIDAELVPAT